MQVAGNAVERLTLGYNTGMERGGGGNTTKHMTWGGKPYTHIHMHKHVRSRGIAWDKQEYGRQYLSAKYKLHLKLKFKI